MKNHLQWVLLALMCSASAAFSQDTLYYRNGSTQIVRITEVGIDEVKYRDYKNQDAPTFNIEKNELKRIGFADGTSFKFNEDPLDLKPSQELAKKTHAVKFEFFSPLADNITIGFEHLVKKGVSFEYKAGFIGAGFSRNENENLSGMLVKFGVKFMNSPEYYSKGMKRTHPLRGGYIKPEIIFNKYQSTITENFLFATNPPVITEYDVTNYAVNIVFGKQKVLGEIAVLDYYIGLGYGGQQVDKTVNQNNSNPPFTSDTESFSGVYSHTFGGKQFPFVFSGGLSLGILF
jgi:hypothetical protein